MAKKPINTESSKAEELPVVTSVGWTKLNDSNSWAVLVIKTQGDKVISVEAEEPNLKEIAIETLKIKVVKKLIIPNADV